MPGRNDEEARDDPHPLAYMTSADPSPYLFESEMHMWGRFASGVRHSVISGHGWRRVVSVFVGLFMIFILVSLLVSVVGPLFSL
jgi:hypothetical protein